MVSKEVCYHIIEQIINVCSSGKQKNNIFPPSSVNIEDIYKIIKAANEIFKLEPTVLQLSTQTSNSDFVIVGDLHGDIDVLVRIFSTKGYPSKTRYLFLGDYVDRGENSCEVIILLYTYKYLYKDNIYLIRGNHEFKEMASNYGFQNECFRRISNKKDVLSYNEGFHFFNAITDTFSSLPISAILNGDTFCVHGGISALIDNRKQLLGLKKVGNEYCSDDSVQVEFLWNDPDPNIDCPYKRSPRGVGCLFNREALDLFLKSMGFKQVIRGHQMADLGFQWSFGQDGGILTLFSSVNYCGAFNEAGIAIYSHGDAHNGFSIDQIAPKSRKTIRFLIDENIILNNMPFCQLEKIPQWISC